LILLKAGKHPANHLSVRQKHHTPTKIPDASTQTNIGYTDLDHDCLNVISTTKEVLEEAANIKQQMSEWGELREKSAEPARKEADIEQDTREARRRFRAVRRFGFRR